MTLEQLLASLRSQRDALIATRGTQTEALTRLRATLDTPTPASAADVDAAIAARAATDAQIDALTGRVDEVDAEIARERALDALQSQPSLDASVGQVRRGPAYDRVVRVGEEARTYRPDTDRAGRQFMRDVARSFYYGAAGDGGASERLSRHMQEERTVRGDQLFDRAASSGPQERAVGTGAFAGLTVPQYLTDLYAPVATAQRPFADACNGHPLPEAGMTFNLSRITTATGVALQSSENSAVQETNIDDTLLAVSVQTAAGQQTMSRQAIERGTGTEDVTMQDLYNQWAVRIDTTLINQATTGLAAVGTAVAYTDASPTAAELYPKVLGAAAGAEAAFLALAKPDIAVMHSRRWYWMQSQLSSTFPLFQAQQFPLQAGGIVDLATQYGSGFRGVLPAGLAVIVDNNCSTAIGAGTEDEIYVTSSAECHLWEDSSQPMFIRAEQPAAGSLGVLMVLYSYFAYTFGRYANGVQRVSGTGLIAPTF